MDSPTLETFFICFGALHLKVQPQMEDSRMHFLVFLPSRLMELYQHPDRNGSFHWYQRGIGRTALAEQLGELIEYHYEQ